MTVYRYHRPIDPSLRMSHVWAADSSRATRPSIRDGHGKVGYNVPICLPRFCATSSSVEQVAPDERETIDALAEQFPEDRRHHLSRRRSRHSSGSCQEPWPAGRRARRLRRFAAGARAVGSSPGPGPIPCTCGFRPARATSCRTTLSTPRGLAIKVLGVDGERLPDSEHDTIAGLRAYRRQGVRRTEPESFLPSIKLLVPTTDKAQGAKEVLSAVLRGTEEGGRGARRRERHAEGVGRLSRDPYSGESFFSQAPIRYGDYIAKVGVFPVSPGTDPARERASRCERQARRPARKPFRNSSPGPARSGKCACSSAPIWRRCRSRDATKVWPEDKSPYLTVARLIAKPQNSWSEERYGAIDTAMSFSPCTGLRRTVRSAASCVS